MLGVATNLMGINTHRNLSVVSSRATKASEKLSSGYRINRSADDAAGLAISEKMRNQIKGLNMGSRNMGEAISLFNVGDGALHEISEITGRMRELAIQASNDTLLDEDREKLDMESLQLIYELDRISEDTEFNKYKIFEADMVEKTVTTTITTTTSVAALKSTRSLSDSYIQNVIAGCTTNEPVNTRFFTGATNYATIDIGAELKKVNPGFDVLAQRIATSVPISQADKEEFVQNFTQAMQNGFNDDGTKTKITGSLDANDYITFTFTDLPQFSTTCTPANIMNSFGHGFLHSMFASSSTVEETSTTTTTTKSTWEADKKALFVQGGPNKDSGQNYEWNALNTKLMKINDLKLNPREEALKAIGKCDFATKYASAVRAAFGAYTNRLEHGIKNVDTSAENLSAAESRIRDADMAKEMMEFAKANVLSQAGMSMLSQANQLPQNIMKVLQ